MRLLEPLLQSPVPAIGYSQLCLYCSLKFCHRIKSHLVVHTCFIFLLNALRFLVHHSPLSLCLPYLLLLSGTPSNNPSLSPVPAQLSFQDRTQVAFPPASLPRNLGLSCKSASFHLG